MGERRVPTRRERQGPIRHVAVMVCTRDRPAELAQCMASLAKVDMPEGVGLTICVADNNEIAIDGQVDDLARASGLQHLYGHEPQRGYASVRNMALSLALQSPAELGIFIDDDSIATPRLVIEHINAIKRYAADVVVGRIEGISMPSTEGERMSKAGTGNVAMRRWIYDLETGAGLAFDERLNLLGFEDFEFFREVTGLGGVIYRSMQPVTITLLPPHTPGPEPVQCPQLSRDLLVFAAMEGRNEIVVTRLRHGLTRAMQRVLSRHTSILMQGIGAYLAGLLLTPFNGRRGKHRRQWGRIKVARFLGAAGGLYRPGYDRVEAKRGRLIELPETGPGGLRPVPERATADRSAQA
ncbi:MAG: glycosyltransferase [Hyphomicrobiaceae bacterium]|nr:glycosyltransferase [Hyphomicrobiaceae bacterium]